jgi:hypothetical protein
MERAPGTLPVYTLMENPGGSWMVESSNFTLNPAAAWAAPTDQTTSQAARPGMANLSIRFIASFLLLQADPLNNGYRVKGPPAPVRS